MNIYVVILAVSVFISVTAALDWLKLQNVQAVEPTARQSALICWHQFATGRRPTSADCPEL